MNLQDQFFAHVRFSVARFLGFDSRLLQMMLCVGVLANVSTPAQAQSASPAQPTTQEMIEQLKAPRTRGLRNLNVEAAPTTPNAAVSNATASNPAPSGNPVTATSIAATGSGNAVAASQTIANSPASRPSLSLLIQFDFNSARVRPESQQALANLSQALQSPELVQSKFAVEGHTDAKGAAEYNRKLSEQRALAVREFLKAQGVGESRLVAAGKGASELANASEPFAAENRRVRIVNLD